MNTHAGAWFITLRLLYSHSHIGFYYYACVCTPCSNTYSLCLHTYKPICIYVYMNIYIYIYICLYTLYIVYDMLIYLFL